MTTLIQVEGTEAQKGEVSTTGPATTLAGNGNKHLVQKQDFKMVTAEPEMRCAGLLNASPCVTSQFMRP